jgi:hypothetical protein
VTYYPGLLADEFAGMEDGEVGDSADVVAGGEVLVLVGVYLEDYGLASHFFCGAGDLRSGGSAGTAPVGPEVDEDRDSGALDDLVEDGGVDLEWLVKGWEGILAGAATSGVGEMVGGETIFLAAGLAGSDRRHWGGSCRLDCGC